MGFLRVFFLHVVLVCLVYAKPQLMQLEKYDPAKHRIKGYLVSQKLDGVRAFWDGKNLISRGGYKIQAPKNFTKDLPPFALDGELWSEELKFAHISGTARSDEKNRNWSKISYNIFDAPTQKGGLKSRLHVVKKYLKTKNLKHVKVLSQTPIKDKKALHVMLQNTIKNGGEGLVLREPNKPYIIGRSKYALKVKPYMDDECEVLSYNEGKGKNEGKMGSINCEWRDAKNEQKIIKIGSGFDDAERQNPPKIGKQITFKYNGFTKNGLPKFPVFLRIRDDLALHVKEKK